MWARINWFRENDIPARSRTGGVGSFGNKSSTCASNLGDQAHNFVTLSSIEIIPKKYVSFALAPPIGSAQLDLLAF
jgi:hypothetical protein